MVQTKHISQTFAVKYAYDVYFTSGLFEPSNPVFSKVIKKETHLRAKVLFIMDERIANSQPHLCDQIIAYTKAHSNTMELCEKPLLMPGGEGIKNDPKLMDVIYQHINDDKIDRHNYIVAIGGGAFLDAIGFAAATAHRGIRLIRVPTTVLAQDDSGVGVKNGINHFGKKNWIGTFAPPYAVLNDFNFLKSLEYRDWLSGLAEAVKVSLIKDANFFNYMSTNASTLKEQKYSEVMQNVICRSAELHMNHIATQGDPFELGSSRPLDFGHWAAHKLEQLTNHRLRHGEAVAIGVCLDSTYSYLTGLLPEKDWNEILDTLNNLGLLLYVPELSQKIDDPEHPDSIFKGLSEFREHLGGELTIMMLKKIGVGMEIHSVDFGIFRKAIEMIKKRFSHPEKSKKSSQHKQEDKI